VGVAAHLGIDLAEYDARIRTFIPDYEEMLGVAASAIPPKSGVIVDLGTGTGALSRRCLDCVPRAQIVGIDADADVLKVAAERLGPNASFVVGNFGRTEIPRCDAVVSSLALHHVRGRAAKRALFRRIRAAMRSGGRFVSVDCYPARHVPLAAVQRAAWRAHLRQTYDARSTTSLFRAWADEDHYLPLETEMDLMSDAGFHPEVLWRRGMFGVLLGIPKRARAS
jgi:tRNA (cmo5U34)-methyltransferase